MLKKLLGKAAAVAAVSALALTACSAEGGSDNGNGGEEPKGDISMAIIAGWDEGIAVTHLWKAILDEKGYNVTIEDISDAGPTYTALSTGDVDIYTDGWLPVTHASLLEEFGDQIVDLGAWNDEAKLTIAVNEDAPITSLTELADNADQFDNRIVGIEPGAGLTEATQDNAIPTYGLDDMDFITSSTAAMLAELTGAIDRGDNIVVTLWKPHWAYDEFPIRDLEDPEGTLGATESIHTFSRMGFEDDFPEVAEWLRNFKMDSELLFSLENAMFNEYDGDDYQPIVKDWIKDNQDYVDSLTN